MRRIVIVIAGGFALLTGFRILAEPDCNSVSFDGQGGRVATVVCSPDDSGALPAGLAGIGLIALGGGVIWFGVKKRG
jgi:hypothetical protein